MPLGRVNVRHGYVELGEIGEVLSYNQREACEIRESNASYQRGIGSDPIAPSQDKAGKRGRSGPCESSKLTHVESSKWFGGDVLESLRVPGIRLALVDTSEVVKGDPIPEQATSRRV
jgi:hypothetical protein